LASNQGHARLGVERVAQVACNLCCCATISATLVHNLKHGFRHPD
jgi:hypothetical protein